MPAPSSAQNMPLSREIKRLEAFKPLKPKQIRFISALVKTNMVVERAAKYCGIEWRNHYTWLQKPDYKQAVEFAKDIVGDTLESIMLDNAVDGRLTPIVYKGKVTGNIREINSSERIALLKGLKPQYREGFSMNNIGPVSLAISYPGQQSGNNDLNKLGNDIEEAKIISHPKLRFP